MPGPSPAIWSLIVPIVALLIGGIVAARTAGIVTRPTGAIHGLVLWSLVTLSSIAMMGFIVRGVLSAAAGLGVDVANTAAAMGTNSDGAPDAVQQSLGVSRDDLIGPVNQRLRAQ